MNNTEKAKEIAAQLRKMAARIGKDSESVKTAQRSVFLDPKHVAAFLRFFGARQ